MKKLWAYLKGKKRNIGLTAALVLGWCQTQGYVSQDIAQLLLSLLTIWGIVAIADGRKKNDQ